MRNVFRLYCCRFDGLLGNVCLLTWFFNLGGLVRNVTQV